MADEVRIGAAGLSVVYLTDPGVRMGGAGLTVVWNDVACLCIGGVGLTVVWTEESAPTPGVRTFPVPNPKTVWQSQAGKRTFPLPGEQVL